MNILLATRPDGQEAYYVACSWELFNYFIDDSQSALRCLCLFKRIRTIVNGEWKREIWLWVNCKQRNMGNINMEDVKTLLT